MSTLHHVNRMATPIDIDTTPTPRHVCNTPTRHVFTAPTPRHVCTTPTPPHASLPKACSPPPHVVSLFFFAFTLQLCLVYFKYFLDKEKNRKEETRDMSLISVTDVWDFLLWRTMFFLASHLFVCFCGKERNKIVCGRKKARALRSRNQDVSGVHQKTCLCPITGFHGHRMIYDLTDFSKYFVV